MQLSPVTDDHAEAAEWFEAMPAMGVESLVAKGAHPNRGCSWGLKPPVSRRDRAM